MTRESRIVSSGAPLYVIPPALHGKKDIIELLAKHPEIKFVSFVGIDFAGNDTDEKVPISLFVKEIDQMLEGTAVQTDGSSVVLPGIASLNDARLDMKIDLDVNWFVDYNYNHIDEETGFYVGTLRIPVFLIHENRMVDSRFILINALKYAESQLLALFKKNAKIAGLNIKGGEVEKIVFTAATELEFWVKTPAEEAMVEELSASQVMQEQYWQRTRGNVRTALEQAVSLLEAYGLAPEMGHKEVGGVKARIDESGNLSHVMEQLEIDWKYADGIQAADNELLVRSLLKEIFRINGLEVTFQAKPIIGIAGNGEHTHVGIAAKLKNGKVVNLFSPANMESDFLSAVGYGAIMGILKNYEVVNPIVSATNDSLNRLKPGFEAPVCIVTSLGHTPAVPSRNRTILAGLVRDIDNPRATRFEVRSPNPFTNTYLALAGFYLSAIDGIKFAVESGKSLAELEAELSKTPEANGDYLEKGRAYRSEEDVFEHYTAQERDAMFGHHPATVWENVQNFKLYPEKIKVLTVGGFHQEFIDSFAEGSLVRWRTELLNKILPEYRELLAKAVCLHKGSISVTDVDETLWADITAIKLKLLKSAKGKPSLFDQLKEALEKGNYEKASKLQVAAQKDIDKLKELYNLYKANNAV
ncbi:MAG: glutamine synthetase [Acidaminococcales bacterium]|nr:glutamine synthetase [Acidaminococcales bacterium]